MAQDRWEETFIDPGISYSAPVEFQNVNLLRALLWENENRLSGFVVAFHPAGSECVSESCRGLSRWQQSLLRERGVTGAYPYTIDGGDLVGYAENTRLRFLTAFGAADIDFDEARFRFYRCVDPSLGFCGDAVFLRLPDTYNAYLIPLVELAEVAAPVDVAPEPEDDPTVIRCAFDTLSRVQMRAVGFGKEPEKIDIPFVPDSSRMDTVPFVVARAYPSERSEIMALGPLPVRLDYPTPVSATTHPSYLFPGETPTSVTTHVTSIPPGPDVDERSAIVTAERVLACGHEASVRIAGVLESWNVFQFALDNLHVENGTHTALTPHITVFCEEAIVPGQRTGTDPSGLEALSGTVRSVTLRVNQITRGLFWEATVDVPIVCTNPMDALLNEELKDQHFVSLRVLAPDDGRNIVDGEQISFMGVPVVHLEEPRNLFD